jgi:ABC-2 type transport system permease protein
MREAVFIALKDLRLLVRDRMALFWALVFPVAFALFIGSVLSSSVARESVRLPIAFVDSAETDASLRLKRELDANQSLAVKTETSPDAARDAVRRGHALGYVHLSAKGETEFGVDPSRASEAALIKAALSAALVTVSLPEGSPVVAVPLREVAVIRSGAPANAFALVFPAAIAWGLMGCAATFAVAMVAERTGGTLIRLRAAPLPRASIVLGKALACTVACLVDAAALLLIARVGFGVRAPDLSMLALALFSVTACFVGLTQVLSTLGRTEQSVSGAGWATLLFMAMLGGAMVPVSLMPDWMQRLSDLSPIRWGILALEGALWRGFGLRDLLLPCAILLAVGALGFTLGLRITGRREA